MSPTKVAENVINSLNCYPSKQSSWWRRLSSSSSEDVFKTSSRRYDQDKYLALLIRLQKTSLIRLDQDQYIRLGHTSSRRLQDVFKTSSKRLQGVLQKRLQHNFKKSSRRFQHVFKTSSRQLQGVLQSLANVFKTLSRRIIKIYRSC